MAILDVVQGAITPDVLMAAGYRRFDEPGRIRENYVASYEKRVTDADGVKYVLHFTHRRLLYPTHDLELMRAEAKFKRDGIVVKVDMLSEHEDLPKVEAFFEETWQAMNFDRVN